MVGDEVRWEVMVFKRRRGLEMDGLKGRRRWVFINVEAWIVRKQLSPVDKAVEPPASICYSGFNIYATRVKMPQVINLCVLV